MSLKFPRSLKCKLETPYVVSYFLKGLAKALTKPASGAKLFVGEPAGHWCGSQCWPFSRLAGSGASQAAYADNKDINMKQNIAILAVIGLVLTGCATRPVATAPVVYQTANLNAPVPSLPPQAQQPAPVIYHYEQQSWPPSAPTQEWKGYVPTVYQPAPNNAFDAAPSYAGAYPGPYAVGSCASGVGLSVGFGVGSCSVGLGPYGISAGVGLGCFPIGVWFGSGCN